LQSVSVESEFVLDVGQPSRIEQGAVFDIPAAHGDRHALSLRADVADAHTAAALATFAVDLREIQPIRAVALDQEKAQVGEWPGPQAEFRGQ
jgi:hypothetical protein